MRIGSIFIFALAVAACSPTASNESPGDTLDVEQELTTLHARQDAAAPPHLIADGDYSDVRFCTMMAPHHQHAIEMAKVEIEAGTHAELVALAREMTKDQIAEINELRDIKQELTSSPDVPMMMNPHSMENAGVTKPEELRHGHDVDSAFLDGMLPHHSGAIQMATVALRHSQNPRVVGLARRIVDAQAKEIGKMIAMRTTWYAGLTHGFPHAGEAP